MAELRKLEELEGLEDVGLLDGVFDPPHEGWKQNVEACKAACRVLVIAVLSDRAIEQLCGSPPSVPEVVRAKKLQETCADYVVIVDSIDECIIKLKPTVLCRAQSHLGSRVPGAGSIDVYFFPESPQHPSDAELTAATLNRPPYVHVFWAGKSFNYARYLAILTALKAHTPKKGLILWTLEDEQPEDSPYWEELKNSDQITIRYASEFVGELIPAYEDAYKRLDSLMSNYHKRARQAQIKDILQWKVLHELGGIFLDMDTISCKPIWPTLVQSGKSMLAGPIPATGVIAAKPKNNICAWISERLESQLKRGDLFAALQAPPDPKPADLVETIVEGKKTKLRLWDLWCYFGPVALLRYVEAHGKNEIFEPPIQWFYTFANDIDAVFRETPDDSCLAQVYAFHYYLSGREEMPSKLKDDIVTPEFIQSSNSPFARAARAVLGIPKSDRQFAGRLSSVGDSVSIGQLQLTEAPSDSGRIWEEDRPLIALTAIMGDEADLIERCFGSIKNIVDQWNVLFNGKDPSTIDSLKKFFAANGIGPRDERGFGYTIKQSEWKGYTRTRNEALEMCDAEYTMKMDLDEEMVGAERLRQIILRDKPDVVHTFVEGGVRFSFPRAWHRSQEAVYVGRDHEILRFKNPAKALLVDPSAVRIIHRSKPKPPEKHELTCALLREDLDDDPNNPRAQFYLGRELLALGKLKQSEYWLRKRAFRRGVWWEETFFALLYLGDNLLAQGRTDEAIEMWKAAAELGPRAKEPFARIASVCYNRADSNQVQDPVEKRRLWNQAFQAYLRELDIKTMPQDMNLFLECKLYTKERLLEATLNASVCIWNLAENRDGAAKGLGMLLDLPLELQADSRVRDNISFFRKVLGI